MSRKRRDTNSECPKLQPFQPMHFTCKEGLALKKDTVPFCTWVLRPLGSQLRGVRPTSGCGDAESCVTRKLGLEMRGATWKCTHKMEEDMYVIYIAYKKNSILKFFASLFQPHLHSTQTWHKTQAISFFCHVPRFLVSKMTTDVKLHTYAMSPTGEAFAGKTPTTPRLAGCVLQQCLS